MSDKTTYLVSPGGSGCTFLYAVFGERFMKGDYKFHNVHQRFAQVKDPENTKILYIAAHPVNILLSIARRFWEPEIWIYHIRMIQGDINGLYNITERCEGGEKPSLKRYAEQGLNLYDFHQHAAGWRWYCNTYGIENMFCRYEDINYLMGEISAFVGKKPGHFEMVDRNSNHETETDQELMEKLRQIHFDDILFWENNELWKTA